MTTPESRVILNANANNQELKELIKVNGGSGVYAANLTGTDLGGANLDGVIGADFTGALNVPPAFR